ncbi:MAG TPA: alpha/beta hydrolase [Segetibacter sp.]
MRKLLVVAVLLWNYANAQDNSSFTIATSGRGERNIIFIPGLGCSPAVWQETINALSGNATCYAVGFSGFAGNKPQENVDIKLWEKDLLRFIKDHKIEKPVLVGHSLGGVIALELASEAPGIISKIVVVDAFPCLPAVLDPAFKASENFDDKPIVDQFVKMEDGQFYNMQKAGFKQMLADTSRLSMLLDWSMKSDRKTIGKGYAYFMNTDLRSKLSAIQCSSLILLQPAFKAREDVVKQQYQLLGKADVKFATKGLHFMMYDDKEWYLNTIKSFLQ